MVPVWRQRDFDLLLPVLPLLILHSFRLPPEKSRSGIPTSKDTTPTPSPLSTAPLSRFPLTSAEGPARRGRGERTAFAL